MVVAAAGLAVAGLRLVRATRPAGLPKVQFVLVAPGARSVAVLGDFNHWDASANPMGQARQHTGTWSTTVAVTPGRHVYTFLIDGTRWVADPRAPRSLDDDFGRPTAVLTIVAGRRST
jgi:1,4-alpha-glucan branching enzyme